ncbi:unnamed protein product [Sphenostylis stenocarpa]|uniref:Uncharacterized protein n=1 Tax=Sphenostylis stenocarpa TaxID=92480 RepID=A0AA86T024_9FABA|nr:unnamed protein product [Sphenostylis stenocarpa]
MAQSLRITSSPFTLSDSTLRVHDHVIMSQVPHNITCTYAPATGCFIAVNATSPPSSHHVETLGKLQPATFVSIFRFQKWKTAIWTGSNGSHVQTETEFLLLQSNPSRPYVLFLPIVDGPFRATLQPGLDDNISVCVESGSSHVTASSYVVYLHAGENPYTVVEEAARVLRDHLGTFKLLEEKTVPRIIEKFGWCTREEFEPEDVRKGVAGLVEGGCPPGFVLLENGVQCMRPIEVLVRALKEEFSTVECVYAWHALSEYWKRDGGMSEIEKLHSQLEAHGIDGVKVHVVPNPIPIEGVELFTLYYSQANKLILSTPFDSEEISLEPFNFELITVSPVTVLPGKYVKFAPIGLVNMLNTGGAVQSLTIDETQGLVEVGVRGTGEMRAYASEKPSNCKIDGIEVDFEYEGFMIKIQVPWPGSSRVSPVQYAF